MVHIKAVDLLCMCSGERQRACVQIWVFRRVTEARQLKGQLLGLIQSLFQTQGGLRLCAAVIFPSPFFFHNYFRDSDQIFFPFILRLLLEEPQTIIDSACLVSFQHIPRPTSPPLPHPPETQNILDSFWPLSPSSLGHRTCLNAIFVTKTMRSMASLLDFDQMFGGLQLTVFWKKGFITTTVLNKSKKKTGSGRWSTYGLTTGPFKTTSK